MIICSTMEEYRHRWFLRATVADVKQNRKVASLCALHVNTRFKNVDQHSAKSKFHELSFGLIHSFAGSMHGKFAKERVSRLIRGAGAGPEPMQIFEVKGNWHELLDKHKCMCGDFFSFFQGLKDLCSNALIVASQFIHVFGFDNYHSKYQIMEVMLHHLIK
ncbi:hypothetical protein VNO80_25194 [Phaseolus coccineus]|uniref:Uncharacterized protein n=1 Tax=Phaseolus coccineus TaxID=3886 RepID=A0AAN9LXD3_PHACN